MVNDTINEEAFGINLALKGFGVFRRTQPKPFFGLNERLQPLGHLRRRRGACNDEAIDGEQFH